MMNPVPPMPKKSKQSDVVSDALLYGAALHLLGCEMLLAAAASRFTDRHLPATSSPFAASASAEADSMSVPPAEAVSHEPAGTDAAPAATEDAATAHTADESSVVLTLPEVRRRITVAAQAGYATQVKDLLAQYGATKLSDVAPDQYQALLADLKDLMKLEVDTDG